jgi:hypothetical protein
MNLSEFIAFHRTTLELDEVKHGLILNGLAQAVRAKALDLSCRTLGEPGQCAIKWPITPSWLVRLKRTSAEDSPSRPLVWTTLG